MRREYATGKAVASRKYFAKLARPGSCGDEYLYYKALKRIALLLRPREMSRVAAKIVPVLLPNHVSRCEITTLFWYPGQPPQAPDRGLRKRTARLRGLENPSG
ncbi:hypothetical protein CWB41_00330 [Methylovirgula ligni]|uniref:hypothetical protein n=1 Tax=Methylovirgula ligni TaxID=569860 RepID=UPI000E27E570|nr:hypothetical protein [Methylovirgula ligni]QAY94373.1 hypothetical protein CWB41_00330 [Methylovirgula ligni]